LVEFSNGALENLKQIREYIAQESPERAYEQASIIIEACRLLDSVPKMGRSLGDGTRKIATRPWIIIYEVKDSGPYIVGIWHGSQDRGAKRR